MAQTMLTEKELFQPSPMANVLADCEPHDLVTLQLAIVNQYEACKHSAGSGIVSSLRNWAVEIDAAIELRNKRARLGQTFDRVFVDLSQAPRL